MTYCGAGRFKYISLSNSYNCKQELTCIEYIDIIGTIIRKATSSPMLFFHLPILHIHR